MPKALIRHRRVGDETAEQALREELRERGLPTDLPVVSHPAMPSIREDLWHATDYLACEPGAVTIVDMVASPGNRPATAVTVETDCNGEDTERLVEQQVLLDHPGASIVRHGVCPIEYDEQRSYEPLGRAGRVALRLRDSWEPMQVFDSATAAVQAIHDSRGSVFELVDADRVQIVTVTRTPTLWRHSLQLDQPREDNVVGWVFIATDDTAE